ncbi:hypothetical protein Tsubulata_006201 [Turnera subulata]|uniref:Uncharacterized protein n=1 Tax=Turnera subulata TaxID=218843 RepID=A0A9Q0FAS1_9ROSI|nr:hypothetical protein Tsubulata_006201 [Turnera subulata]
MLRLLLLNLQKHRHQHQLWTGEQPILLGCLGLSFVSPCSCHGLLS